PMAERMSKLWRTLSFRKKRSSSRRHEGGGGSGGSGGSRAGASFRLEASPSIGRTMSGKCAKYLGCMEAYESRGMQVCEEAIKNLMKAKSKHHKRAVLYVNGEALRVVDEITK
uniref:PID domain-containing protein n=1 Tax=Macrostomum lignano TaxID=282301 RepID=A0A1I8IQU2_9PLAT